MLNSPAPSIFRHGSAEEEYVLPLSICLLGNFSGYRKRSGAFRLIPIDSDCHCPARTFERLKPTLDLRSPTSALTRLTRLEDLVIIRRRALAGDAAALQTVKSPEFLEVESSWRSLQVLCKAAEQFVDVEIKALDSAKRDLLDGVMTAKSLGTSPLDLALIDGSRTQPSYKPISLLVSSFECDIQSEQDLQCLEWMAEGCRRIEIPLVASITTGATNTVRFGQATDSWRSFRRQDSAAFTFLSVTRYLNAVSQVGPTATRVEGSSQIWGTSGILLTLSLMRAFAENGWTARAGYKRAPLPPVNLEKLGFDSDTDRGAVILEDPMLWSAVDELSSQGINAPLCCMGSSTIRFFHAVAATTSPQNNLRLGERLLTSQVRHYLDRLIWRNRDLFLSRNRDHSSREKAGKDLIDAALAQLVGPISADTYRLRPISTFTVIPFGSDPSIGYIVKFKPNIVTDVEDFHFVVNIV